MIGYTILAFSCLGLGIGLLSAAYINGSISRTYYVNIYRFPNGDLYSDRLLCKNKREAKFDSSGRNDYVKTIKIKL